MTTQITQESFEAFLKCPTKSRLYTNGAHGIESEFGEWQRRTQERYNAAAAQQLRSSLQANEWCIGAPPAEQFNQRCYRLIFDYPVADPEIQARLHGSLRGPRRASFIYSDPLRCKRKAFRFRQIDAGL